VTTTRGRGGQRQAQRKRREAYAHVWGASSEHSKSFWLEALFHVNLAWSETYTHPTRPATPTTDRFASARVPRHLFVSAPLPSSHTSCPLSPFASRLRRRTRTSH